MTSQPYLVDRLQGFGTTIFAEMSALANQTGAVNLGQGFPDTDGPAEISEAAIAAIREGHNQYPPGPGIPSLREAIAEHQQRFYDLSFDPDTEVLVTAGATEALAATMLALLEAGDEVVMFEPYYDSYAAGVAMAGGVRRVVTLRPPEPGESAEGADAYGFDEAEFRAAVTDRTKLILLNTPHNPTGKVFTAAELQLIAEVASEHDLLVVTDEVYEHLVFTGQHLPIAGLPGMAERTVTISSAGKTFSFTGWKIGWVCAPPELVAAIRTAKQFLTFVNGAPFQHAVAVGLRMSDDYFESFSADMASKGKRLAEGLRSAGFGVYEPEGTYFITTDIRPFGETDGFAFCRSLPERCGVVGVPNVVFYDTKSAGQHLVRWTFCKRMDVIDEAIERLGRLSEI